MKKFFLLSFVSVLFVTVGVVSMPTADARVLDFFSINLEQCLDDLETRDAELDACVAELEECGGLVNVSGVSGPTSTREHRTDFRPVKQCLDDLKTRDAELGACVAELGECEGGVCMEDLDLCNADLGTCDSALGTCDSALGTCDTDLGLKQVELDLCVSDLGTCGTDLGTCETDLGTCEDNLAASDGFIDNGDETVTDVRSGLMWEKKDDSGGVHDKDNIYTWVGVGLSNPDGTLYTVFLDTLNNKCDGDETISCANDGDCTDIGNGLCGHAGYRDWRIPRLPELGGILCFTCGICGGAARDSGQACISPVFGPTLDEAYWCGEPMSFENAPGGGRTVLAEIVRFRFGNLASTFKTASHHARAVRCIMTVHGSSNWFCG